MNTSDISKKWTPDWKRCSNGNVPDHAVQGGWDHSDIIYIGRAEHKGDLLPGKIVPAHQCCYISYAGKEHRKGSYEVLCNPNFYLCEWVRASNGSIPPGSIKGGATSSGEPLYISRVQHNGTLTVGKVHPSHRCAYIPYDGREHTYSTYEILTSKSIAS